LEESLEREKRIMADTKELEEDLEMVKAQLKEYQEKKSATQEERQAKAAIIDMLKTQVNSLEDQIAKQKPSKDHGSHYKPTLQKHLSTVDEEDLPESPVKILVTQPTEEVKSDSDSVKDVESIQEEVASESRDEVQGTRPEEEEKKEVHKIPNNFSILMIINFICLNLYNMWH
jgi:hypothetical protein